MGRRAKATRDKVEAAIIALSAEEDIAPISVRSVRNRIGGGSMSTISSIMASLRNEKPHLFNQSKKIRLHALSKELEKISRELNTLIASYPLWANKKPEIVEVAPQEDCKTSARTPRRKCHTCGGMSVHQDLDACLSDSTSTEIPSLEAQRKAIEAPNITKKIDIETEKASIPQKLTDDIAGSAHNCPPEDQDNLPTPVALAPKEPHKPPARKPSKRKAKAVVDQSQLSFF
jgi:hypothetical protein